MSGPIRVLLVDDDPAMVKLTAEYLQEETDRMEPLTVTSATEGLDTLAEESIDCIVSDYDMPGMDGLDFLKAVRDDYPELPFILFTGKGSEEIAGKAISAGVSDYLQKGSGPEQFTILSNRIENVVETYRTQSTLEKRTRRLETLIDNLPGVVYRARKGPTRPIEYIEGGCADLTGYSASELETHDTVYGEDVIHPDDQAHVWDTVETALAAGEAFEMTYRICTRDGQIRWVWERGRGVETATGEVDAFEGFITDITDRVEQTQQLRETEARYEALAQAFPDYAFFYDADGYYIDALLGWEGTEGRTNRAEDLIGKHIYDVLSEDAADVVSGAVQQALNTGAIQTTEYQMDTLEGQRWYEGRATPLNEPLLGEEAVIFVARDITQRYETQEELQRQNQRLEQFVDVMSHDLRGQLHVAHGRLDLARNTGESEHLEKADDALNHMEAIIEDTVQLARHGQSVSEMEEIYIPDLAERCWSAGLTDAELEVVDEFSVRGDPLRLRRLFENLFQNTIEHGGADVTVYVGTVNEKGFYIADDGPGISEARREEVLEPGYTTTEDVTGFGLSIVNELVEAHGWSIAITSGPEGGARFEITGVDVIR